MSSSSAVSSTGTSAGKSSAKSSSSEPSVSFSPMIDIDVLTLTVSALIFSAVSFATARS